MTRLQTGLLIVLGLMTAAVLAQADWFHFLPFAMAAIAAVAGWVAQGFSWLASVPTIVPTWVWWAIFGIMMSRWCACGGARFRAGHCGPHRRHWKAASETA